MTTPTHNERVLKTLELTLERKTFIFTVRENDRGKIVRIEERAPNGRRSFVIMPAPGLAEFSQALTQLESYAV